MVSMAATRYSYARFASDAPQTLKVVLPSHRQLLKNNPLRSLILLLETASVAEISAGAHWHAQYNKYIKVPDRALHNIEPVIRSQW